MFQSFQCECVRNGEFSQKHGSKFRFTIDKRRKILHSENCGKSVVALRRNAQNRFFTESLLSSAPDRSHFPLFTIILITLYLWSSLLCCLHEGTTDYLGFLDSDTGKPSFLRKVLGYQLKTDYEGNITGDGDIRWRIFKYLQSPSDPLIREGGQIVTG